MLEIVNAGPSREEQLLEKAKIAIQDMLQHSDRFPNPDCLQNARAFLRELDEVKNATQRSAGGTVPSPETKQVEPNGT